MKSSILVHWKIVAFAFLVVGGDILLSSQLRSLALPKFSWSLLSGAYGSCSLGDAVDAPELTWTTGGNSSWAGKLGVGKDEIDAAQSGSIGNSQSTWVETTVVGPCTMTYWCKVSSEYGRDVLLFYVDGDLQSGSLSGSVGWALRTNVVGVGEHSFFWVYAKDGSGASGDDAAWLDQVQVLYGADVDSNGIPDIWQWRYFGAIGGVTTDSDWDQDGSPDISEFYAGTDPTNDASVLKFISIESMPGRSNVSVRWSCVTSRYYRLDRSTNLSTGYSVLASNISATQADIIYTDSVKGVGPYFYKVGVRE